MCVHMHAVNLDAREPKTRLFLMLGAERKTSKAGLEVRSQCRDVEGQH